jgi:hypothetical protein
LHFFSMHLSGGRLEPSFCVDAVNHTHKFFIFAPPLFAKKKGGGIK